MNTISTISHQQSAQFFVKQEDREKIAPREKELQGDQVQIKSNFRHVQQADLDRVANWTTQDAQNAISRIQGKDLTSVHGHLDQTRVQMLINRIAA